MYSDLDGGIIAAPDGLLQSIPNSKYGCMMAFLLLLHVGYYDMPTVHLIGTDPTLDHSKLHVF